jgi:hypothetical protein
MSKIPSFLCLSLRIFVAYIAVTFLSEHCRSNLLDPTHASDCIKFAQIVTLQPVANEFELSSPGRESSFWDAPIALYNFLSASYCFISSCADTETIKIRPNTSNAVIMTVSSTDWQQELVSANRNGMELSSQFQGLKLQITNSICQHDAKIVQIALNRGAHRRANLVVA